MRKKASFTVNLVEMDFAYLVHDLVALEGDETEAPMPIGHLVVGQHSVFDLETQNHKAL